MSAVPSAKLLDFHRRKRLPSKVSARVRALAEKRMKASGLTYAHIARLRWSVLENAHAECPGPAAGHYHPVPAIRINYFDGTSGAPKKMLDGLRDAYQIRYLESYGSDPDGAQRRYDQEQASGSLVFATPGQGNRFVGVTEGAFKAASASLLMGVNLVGLGGITCGFQSDGDLQPELRNADWIDGVVVLIFDNEPAAKHASRKNVAAALQKLRAAFESRGLKVRIKFPPPVWPDKKTGIDDFIVTLLKRCRGDVAKAKRLFYEWLEKEEINEPYCFGPGQQFANYAYLKAEDRFVYLPTMSLIGAAGVNASVRPQSHGDDGKPLLSANELRHSRRVDFQTWVPYAPGSTDPREQRIVQGWSHSENGWQPNPEAVTLNRYLPPTIEAGDPRKAGPWIDFGKRLFPDEHLDLIRVFAFKVQHPGTKVQYGIAIGGDTGIGKDSWLAPLRHAVGPASFADISPVEAAGQWTSFLAKVFCRINEAADSGTDTRDGVSRRKMFDHTKTWNATPPEVLRVHEKYISGYDVPNVVQLIYTTNHAIGAIFLDEADRRHLCAWSPLPRDPEDPLTGLQNGPNKAAANALWEFYDRGGIAHVVAYLRTLDLTGFDPNAAPRRTSWWRQIVNAEVWPEDAVFAEALERIGNPDALVPSMLLVDGMPEDDRGTIAEQIRKSWSVVRAMSRLGFSRTSPIRGVDAR